MEKHFLFYNKYDYSQKTTKMWFYGGEKNQKHCL